MLPSSGRRFVRSYRLAYNLALSFHRQYGIRYASYWHRLFPFFLCLGFLLLFLFCYYTERYQPAGTGYSFTFPCTWSTCKHFRFCFSANRATSWVGNEFFIHFISGSTHREPRSFVILFSYRRCVALERYRLIRVLFSRLLFFFSCFPHSSIFLIQPTHISNIAQMCPTKVAAERY